MGKYLVMMKSARVPGNYKGEYVRVGVVELEDGFEGEPKMLTERAKGIKRIVKTWERLNKGKTRRCAAAIALKQAQDLAVKLTKESEEEE